MSGYEKELREQAEADLERARGAQERVWALLLERQRAGETLVPIAAVFQAFSAGGEVRAVPVIDEAEVERLWEENGALREKQVTPEEADHVLRLSSRTFYSFDPVLRAKLRRIAGEER